MALTRDPRTINIYDVELLMRPASQVTRDELESVAFEVEQALNEHACGENFGAAVSCVFVPATIEISLTVPAVSGAVVNKRVIQILETIDEHVGVALDLEEQSVAPEAADEPATAG